MQIELTEKEREEIKEIIISEIKLQLINDFRNSMTREIIREGVKETKITIKEHLIKTLTNYLTEERIIQLLGEVFGSLKEKNHRGENWFQEKIKNAVLDVAQSQGKLLGDKLTHLLYSALENLVQEKSKKEDSNGLQTR